MKIEFADAKALFDQCGIDYGLEYEYRGKGEERKSHSVEVFSDVRLPLTARDWVRLCMREPEPYLPAGQMDDGTPLYERSEYMGGCCGNMGAVQDRVNGWFRDGGRVSAAQLVGVGEAMRDHDDDDGDEFSDKVTLAQLKEAADQFKNPEKMRAWQKIGFCYQLVKHCYGAKLPSAARDHIEPMEEALNVVSGIASALRWDRIFGRNEADLVKHKATRIRALQEFGPAIKLLHEKFQDMVPEAIEGWAFVDLEAAEDRVGTWDQIATMRSGLAILASKEEAEELLSIWRENDKEFKEEGRRGLREKTVDERVALRPVRVSMEEGLVFLDRDPHPPLRWPAGNKDRRIGWLQGKEPVEDRLYEIWAEGWAYEKDDHEGRGSDMWYHAQKAWDAAAEYFGGEGDDKNE
jgi:hypothetical protein